MHFAIQGSKTSATNVKAKMASVSQSHPISQSTGIQQLLQAEKRAAEKVAEARKSKVIV